MSEVWLLVMSAILEVIMAYQLFDHFYEIKLLEKKMQLLYSAGIIIVIIMISLFKNHYLNTIALFFIMSCYARLLFKCKLSQALFSSIAFVMIGMVAEIGTSFGVSFAFDVNTSNMIVMTDYKIVVYFISKSLLIIIVRIIIATIPSIKCKEINKSQLYLIVFPIFAILNEFLLLHFGIKYELERKVFLMCMLVGIGLIYGGLLLIMVYEQGIQKCVLENELSLAKQKEEANETFYRLQERNLEEVRAVMHDFKKQLLNLQQMYGTNEDEASQYHQALMQILESQIKRQIIDFNNKVLSSIIQRAQIRCEQMNIVFNVKSNVYELGFLAPMDTSTIFDNALDNAIEACCKMKSTEEKRVDLIIHDAGYFTLIEISNTYEEEPIEEDGVLITSKEEKLQHGYGVQNILTVAQKYGGDGMYEYGDGIFKLLVRVQASEV